MQPAHTQEWSSFMGQNSMRKRVLLTRLPSGAWSVDLPTYNMIAGTHQPIVEELIHANGLYPKFTDEDLARLAPTVEVELPDDWPIKADGQLDAERLRAMYRDHPRFGAKAYIPPVFLD